MSNLLAIGLPSPIKLQGRHDRRFCVPMLSDDPYFLHGSRRFFIPISTYLDEIDVCLHGMKNGDLFTRESYVMRAVEGALGLKFKHGRRSFRKWLLKHKSRTRSISYSFRNDRKYDRRKIKEPAVHLNPAMEPCFIGFNQAIRKANQFRGRKIECSSTSNSLCV